jgi:hypothetical protein
VRASTTERGENFPIDNLTYDLITIIHEKSKGLEAYEKYIADAQEHEEIIETLEMIRQQDEECLAELQQHLSQLLAAGQTAGRQASSAASASQGRSTAAGRKGSSGRR